MCLSFILYPFSFRKDVPEKNLMRSLSKSFVLLVVLCVAASSLFAQRSRQKIEIEKPSNYSAPLLSSSSELESILASAARETLGANPGSRGSVRHDRRRMTEAKHERQEGDVQGPKDRRDPGRQAVMGILARE